MPYLFGFIWVLAGLVASPLSASAQAGEEEGGSRLERWHPEAFVDPAEPALRLELTPAGVDIAPNTPRTVDGYTLDEVELRVRRAKIGVGVSTAAVGVGLAMVGGAAVNSIWCSGEPCPPPRLVAALSVGAVLAVGGLVTMIVSSVALHRRKSERERLREANHERPGRARWDPAQSRLVF